jgi:adenine deaminase
MGLYGHAVEQDEAHIIRFDNFEAEETRLQPVLMSMQEEVAQVRRSYDDAVYMVDKYKVAMGTQTKIVTHLHKQNCHLQATLVRLSDNIVVLGSDIKRLSEQYLQNAQLS